MSLQARTATFTASRTTGSQALTGAGFAPKAVLIEVANLPATGFSTGLRFCFGIGLDSTHQGCEGVFADDAVTTSTAIGTFNSDRIIRVLTGTGTTLANATLTSLDADGCTLNWTTVPATGIRFMVTFLGGTDLTNLALVAFNQPASAGRQAITGVGFKPNGAIFLSAKSTGGDSASSARMSIGFADASGGQGLVGFRAVNGVNPSQTFAECRNDCCTNSPSDNIEASFVSWDSDGCTLNWFNGTPTSTRKIIGLFWKGGSCKILTAAQPVVTDPRTLPVTVDTTGFGFTPRGALLGTVGKVHATNEQSGAALSLGFADGTNNAAWWAGAANGVSPTQADSADSAASSLLMYSPPSTASAEASVSMISGGIRATWSAADVTAREFTGIAFGDTLAIVSTLPPTTVTQTTATLEAIVNPNRSATTYHFEYGKTTSYGSSTTETSAGSSTSDVAVSEPITGMAANTPYHYRVVATTPGGITYGSDIGFCTAPRITSIPWVTDSMESSTHTPFFLGWEPTTSSVALSTAQAYRGNQSLLCQVVGGNGLGYARDLLSHEGGWADGDDVTYSFAFYLTPGFNAASSGNKYCTIFRADNFVAEDGSLTEINLRQFVAIVRHDDLSWHMIVQTGTIETVMFDVPTPNENVWHVATIRERWSYTNGSAITQLSIDTVPIGSSNLPTLVTGCPTPNRYRAGIVSTGGGQTTTLALYLDDVSITSYLNNCFIMIGSTPTKARVKVRSRGVWNEARGFTYFP